MKNWVLALAAAATVATPLAFATDAAAQGRRDDRREWGDDRRWDNDRRDNRRDNRWDDRRGDRWDDRGRGRGRGPDGYGPPGQRRNDNRWDDRRYNGYYLGNTWYYGAPRVTYYNRYDYRPGYRAWQRGQYLPPAYRGYVVNDWQRYRLRPPPRGYHWVQHNNDYILAAIATGLILEVFSNNW